MRLGSESYKFAIRAANDYYYLVRIAVEILKCETVFSKQSRPLQK